MVIDDDCRQTFEIIRDSAYPFGSGTVEHDDRRVYVVLSLAARQSRAEFVGEPDYLSTVERTNVEQLDGLLEGTAKKPRQCNCGGEAIAVRLQVTDRIEGVVFVQELNDFRGYR